ncbi:MAG: isoleucine--tRNA ligase [Verrucomicrobiae bacterium]|nr:isoleucine--tRNA ligase [Verrucomicrobiae bacterium]
MTTPINYKNTLNLPESDFPMKADLTKREPEILKRWEKEEIYRRILASRENHPAFHLHDGPPFANGDAHMGHALNITLKDIVLKSKTMSGHRVPFVPGWDCHGLPIEFKVMKDLGSKARQLSPAEIRGKCDEYARKYIGIQREQFKRLGVFGEWENPYLTIDPVYEAEVLRLFAEIVEKDMVYQSLKPVSWSTGAQTALAEAEVEYLDHETPAVFVRFAAPQNAEDLLGLPVLKGLKTSVVIWTTTPWTLPANLAVALRSSIPYAILANQNEALIVADALHASITALVPELGLHKIGTLGGQELLKLKSVRHPFLDRDSVLLTGDTFVTTDTGTGLVHIAPGHGKDDYHVGKHLGVLSPVDDYGRFTAEAGVDWLTGQNVFAANRDIIDKILKPAGALLHEETFNHTYPHCWRSKTPIVFRSVEQWFIKIEESGLKPAALQAIDGVKWVPDWGRNRITGAVESRGDWCISRQRTWGIPLPAFYHPEKGPVLDPAAIRRLADLVEKEGSNVWFASEAPALAARLGLPEAAVLTKKNDTIDVWIDSGSSHRAVARTHPHVTFPADMYLEGSDQHRGWFQSSLLTSVITRGTAPYKTVLTNGFVVDLDGKKLSKSGTGYSKPINLMNMVEKYGADILRLWVASENYQNDVPWSEEIFNHVSGSYRTLRNTLRILHGNIGDFDPAQDAVDLSAHADNRFLDLDRYFLGKLQGLIRDCLAAYEAYEFFRVYHLINNFCSVDLSALYVDITKDRMYCDLPHSLRRRASQTVMHETLKSLTLLSAPLIPFTAEEMWGFLHPNGGSVHTQSFPAPRPDWQQADLEETIAVWLKVRSQIAAELEKARQQKLIGKSIEAWVRYVPENGSVAAVLRGAEEVFAEFIIVSHFELVTEGPTVQVLAGSGFAPKCARSWKYDRSVGTHPVHPNLTARDAEAVEWSLAHPKS